MVVIWLKAIKDQDVIVHLAAETESFLYVIKGT